MNTREHATSGASASDLPLHVDFGSAMLDRRLNWDHAPAHWSIDTSRGVLVVKPEARTDLWQRTYYGFQADNAPSLLAEVSGDFVLETAVETFPRHQYDQAGLVVRFSPSCWLKTSVEYEPEGPDRLGAVVTNGGWSDWSTQDAPPGAERIGLRIHRISDYCRVEYALGGGDWSQIRLAHLCEGRDGATARCGLYACSPKAGGFRAEFSFLRLARPAD